MNKKLVAIGIGIAIGIAIVITLILMTIPLSTTQENTNETNMPSTNATQKPVITGRHITVNLNETIPLSSK